jgi:hypothetical protein
MPVAEKKKVSYVTYDGRTIVDTKALLQDPKVREIISKLKFRRPERGNMKILKKK